MGNSITRKDTGLNESPVASPASHSLDLLPQNQSSINITLDATDEDGDSLTYSIVSDASYGTTSINGSTLTYLTNPSTQSAQTESFSFKANDGTVDSDAVTITIDLKTDPLYQYQWYLNNTGQTNFATNAGTAGQDLNVDSVIADGITGNGIKISIVDDGLEIAHEDIVDNVVSGSWNFIDSGTDPTQSSSFSGGGHGTSIGGIIAAKGWNNKGVRGIAPNASIFGYNFLEVGFSSQHDESLGVNSPGGVTADIYNMSYGAAYGIGANGFLLPEYNLPWYMTESEEEKFINGTSNLRDGKGAIYTWAAGNEFNDSSITDFCGNGEPLSCTETSIDSTNAMPYIIAVGALDANGLKTTYSTPGAGLWVSGFGGGSGYNSDIYGSDINWEDGELDPAVMTIDRSGCINGYSSGVDGEDYSGVNTFDIGGFDFADNENLNSTCSYVSTFGGTSAAAPTVAGVVALILEANPNLTWRDVKHILVTTSDKIDVNRTTSLAGVSQYDWITNAAGHEHHNWYGFGKINASAAVSAAKSYTADSLGQFINTGYLEVSPNSAIEDGQATTSTIEVTKPSGSNGIVEFVRVSLSFNHPAAWSVGVRLQSPSGTVINLMQPNTNIANPEDTLFEIGASAFYGESLEGTWTIQLIDYYTDNSGTFNTFGIQIYGN
jgi:subtilisin family serine protease